MRYRHIILLLVFLNILSVSWAVEGRPKMRRACLNRLDSTLDLLWFKPTDNCGSFTSFSLYGRDDILGLYQYLGNYQNYALDNIQLKLKNLRNWEFYLVYNKACNGIDSVFSDTINIDNQAPFDSQIDSVSVDFATQKTIIGWTNNPSNDIKGYLVYYVTGTNAVIQNTQQTNFLDNSSRNPTQNVLTYSIAAYDSCENTSLISQSHSTILLNRVYNECLKTISLSWTNYVGWQVKEYQIFRRINAQNYELVGTVVSNINQFTYNFNTFGDTYCFYIRAIKFDNTSSSSSNIVCVTTSPIIASQNSYVAKASVQNKHIELAFVTEMGTSVQNIIIYKAENNASFALWKTINTNGGLIEINDSQVNVQRNTYSYYFTTQGPCNFIFDTSQIAKTILLDVVMNAPGDQDLKWSLYNRFIKNTERQEVLLGNSIDFNKSSPWNINANLNETNSQYKDNSIFSNSFSELCYCIRAIENNPNATFTRKDTSYSNIRCVTAEPIVYFPNAIQINGFNNIFKPKGLFLDTELSEVYIYNRWGELVFIINDINLGWDGTNIKGDFVQSDVYMYKAYITGINGDKLQFNGTITVLK
ncbi:MAG: gliding motility-associated C-terminal domain-containing protein [Bacteroidota bacterium]|nr:gliding motility-associated C-terminal domain-containing protein [Bacteroidota bacterium]